MEMQTGVAKSNKFKLKKLVPIAIVLSIMAIAAFIIVPAVKNRIARTANAVTSQQRTARVETGDKEISVSGSAPIEAINRSDITVSASGEVVKVNFLEGDRVEKDDVLLEIDNSASMKNLKKLEKSLAQAEETLESDMESFDGLVVKAPFSGMITSVGYEKNDEVGKNAVVCVITDKSEMKYTVEMNAGIAGFINTGSTINVTLQEVAQIITGKVVYKSAPYVSETNTGKVCALEIILDNPGSVKSGMNAGAQFEHDGVTYNSENIGKLTYIRETKLKCIAGGTVEAVYIKENQLVESGKKLYVFSNDQLEATIENDQEKIDDIKEQIDSLREELSNYEVKAPIAGTITALNVEEGDTIRQNSSSIGTIIDLDNLQFSIDVDELDISKISAGQLASITIDALTDTTDAPLMGTVTAIATEGSSSNGVAWLFEWQFRKQFEWQFRW